MPAGDKAAPPSSPGSPISPFGVPRRSSQRELKFRRATTVDQRVARGGKKRGIAENPNAVRYHPRLTGHDSLFGIEGHGHQRAIPHEQQLAIPDCTRHIDAAEGRRDQSLRALAIWRRLEIPHIQAALRGIDARDPQIDEMTVVRQKCWNQMGRVLQRRSECRHGGRRATPSGTPPSRPPPVFPTRMTSATFQVPPTADAGNLADDPWQPARAVD